MRPVKLNPMDVKNLLYGWCGVHKFSLPVYQNRCISPKFNEKGKKTGHTFEAEVSLTIFDKLFKSVGSGANKRQAQTEAATKICELLKAAGYDVNENMLPKIIKKSNSVASADRKRKQPEQSGPENFKRQKPELIVLDDEPAEPLERSNLKSLDNQDGVGDIINDVNDNHKRANESLGSDVEILDYQKPAPELINLNDSAASAEVGPGLGSSKSPKNEPEGAKNESLNSKGPKSDSRNVNESKSASRDIILVEPESASRDLKESKNESRDPEFDLMLLGFKLTQNLSKDKVEKLSYDLWSHYFSVKQTDHVFALKYNLMNSLNEYLKRYYNPNSYLYIFGSSITGLGSYNADLDLCFVVPPFSRDEHNMDQRKFALFVLRRLRGILYGYYSRHVEQCDAINLISARVPILKLMNVRFADLNVDVDINVNNTAGVRNSHLLHYYSMIDERFAALVLAVKHWAITADIAAPVNGTLSGLSLSLMVLHFLQRHGGPDRPAVLPNLHQILPHHFNERTRIAELKIFDPSILPAHIRPSPNKQPIAELLVEFFDYYVNRVNFEEQVISVRTNGVLKSRSSLPHDLRGTDCFIYVEEPYDFTNCARCVFEKKNFLKIKVAFSEAFVNLRRHMTLSSIGINL